MGCPETCKSDSDCTHCKDGQTACLEGKCSKSEQVICPANCKTNADCVNCSGGRTLCVSNTCTNSTQPECPTSCKQDSECLKCPNQARHCINGQCAIKPAVCKSPCANNDDCIGCSDNKNYCINGQCVIKPAVCKSPCANNNDCIGCSDNKSACINGQCQVPPQCPASCKDNAACTACGEGYVCEQNVCKQSSVREVDLGEECDEERLVCKTGLICGEVSNKSTCYQECTEDPDVCKKNTDGRINCVKFFEDEDEEISSVCFSIAQLNEKCYYGGKQASCQENLTPPLYCSQKDGICKLAQLVSKVGDACSNSEDETEPPRICDPKQGLTCDENTSKCITGKGYGDICDDDCTPDLECLYDEDADVGYCSPECTKTNTCPEHTNSKGQKTNPVCEDLGDGSKYCLFVCNQSEPCPDNTTCQDYDGDKYCSP